MTPPDAQQSPSPIGPTTNGISASGPTGSETLPKAHHLHASSIVFLLVARIRSYLFPAIIAAVAAASGGFFLAMMLGFGFLLAVTVDVVRLFTLRYYIAGGELVVREGLLFRQQRTIPLSRIQNIDLLQNPLHRMFNVAEVRVETASGSEPEATLRVLSLEEVDRLKHQLVHGRTSETDLGPATPSAPASDATHRRELLNISPRELVSLGLISNRGMVLVAIAMGAIYEFDLQERLDWGWAERAARQAWQANLAAAIVAGSLIFIGAMLMLRVLSVLWCLLRFYGYCLTTDGDNLRVSAGMFTKVTATVPRRRVQFISIHRSWLARWMGRASIRIETAGGGAQANEDARATIGRRWFVPIVREQAVVALMHELRDGLVWNEGGFPWRSLHPRAGRRLANKAILVSIFVCLLGLVLCLLGLDLAWPFGVLAGPVLLPLFLWHARRYAASLRYARFEDGVVYRSGVLLKKTSVTFFDKVQAVEVRQTPFDRRWGMAQLRIDTAAAGPAEHHVHVKLLDEQFTRDEFTVIARMAARHRLLC